jgi:uncharacterized protein (DUF1800 family)
VHHRRVRLLHGLGVLVLFAASALAATSGRPATVDDRAIAHVLNRITFGPRPGDVEQVRRMGIEAFIDRQLHPERIDDRDIDARLVRLTTTRESSAALLRDYYRPAQEARREQKTQQAVRDQALDQPPRMTTPEARRERQVLADLTEQKILRAVYSERQLQEVLTDFWFNHFNVFAGKNLVRVFVVEHEREAIRPHVLGHFRDLLGATAKSPAMLVYLDNAMSAAPGTTGRRPSSKWRWPAVDSSTGSGAQAAKKHPTGINENYARELLELHTLGVDGGYTQQDVVAVARVFTGWTLNRPRRVDERTPDDTPMFAFEPRLHDEGDKLVLGHVIRSHGQKEGEEVLDLLARHPATARFLATKLVRRFVSDRPPPALVDRVAARFVATDGNLRDVMRTILESPEFLSPDSYRVKVKTPLEFIVSALRATKADVESALPLGRALRDLGMPVYFCQPPTGYKDTAEAWVNTGALMSRMNIALALSTGEMRGVMVDPEKAIGPRRPDADDMADAAIRALLAGDASPSTRATLLRATDTPKLLALTLGAPEFQRR